jgi:hypothetical protein
VRRLLIQGDRRRDHRRAPPMDDIDDLAAVNPL